MIQLNPRYEATFKVKHIFHQPSNISILLMNVEADFIKEALNAGLYKQVVRITSDIRHRSQDYGVPSYIYR